MAKTRALSITRREAKDLVRALSEAAAHASLVTEQQFMRWGDLESKILGLLEKPWPPPSKLKPTHRSAVSLGAVIRMYTGTLLIAPGGRYA